MQARSAQTPLVATGGHWRRTLELVAAPGLWLTAAPDARRSGGRGCQWMPRRCSHSWLPAHACTHSESHSKTHLCTHLHTLLYTNLCIMYTQCLGIVRIFLCSASRYTHIHSRCSPCCFPSLDSHIHQLECAFSPAQDRGAASKTRRQMLPLLTVVTSWCAG